MPRPEADVDMAGVKIVCGSCGEAIPDDAVELAEGGIRARCPACHARHERSLGERAAADEAPVVRFNRQPARPSEGACPKCDQPIEQAAEACAHCGLSRTHFASFTGSDDHKVSPALRKMWSELAGGSAPDEAHERFIERVASEGAFVFGARCYRSAARERQAGAEARLARIRRMAEVALLAAPVRPREDEPEPYRRVVMMLIALVLVTGLGGLYALFKGSDVPAPSGPKPVMSPEKQAPRFAPPPSPPLGPAAAPSERPAPSATP